MDTNSPVPKWSDIADKDEFKALAPEQQEQTRATYFDRVIAPGAPAEHLDSIRAEFDKRTMARPVGSPEPKQEKGFWAGVGNTVRGAGERVGDLAGGLMDAVGAAAEASPTGIIGGDPTRPSIRPQKILTPEERKEVGDMHHASAEKLRATDFGYDPGRYTLDGAKGKFDQGDYLGALTEGWAAGMDTLGASAPDMVAVATGAGIGPYIMARSGEMANERAKNKGMERATAVELREAAPFAAASAMLERVLPRRLVSGRGEMTEEAAREVSNKAIRHVIKKAANEGVKGFGIEGGTEFIQEGVFEYLGENYGTDVELSARDAFARGAEAAILGGIGGGTLSAAKGAVDGVRNVAKPKIQTPDDIEAELDGDTDIDSEVNSLEDELAAQKQAAQQTDDIGYAPGQDDIVQPMLRSEWLNDGGVDFDLDARQAVPGAIDGGQPIPYDQFNKMAAGESLYWVARDGGEAREVVFEGVVGNLGGKEFASVEIDGRKELVPLEELNRMPVYRDESQQEPLLQPEAPEGTIDFERTEVPSQDQFELVDTQPVYDGGLDFSPSDLQQDTSTRDNMAAGVERLIDQHIDKSRDEKLPEGLKDPRLLREEYRMRLGQMVGDLVEGGGIGYTRDAQGNIDGRTPSINPEWFKSLNNVVTTKEARTAVEKAIAGEKLGPRQATVVQAMLDEVQQDRESVVPERIRDRTRAIMSRDAKRIAESLIDPELALPESDPAHAALSELVADVLESGYPKDKLQSLIQKHSVDGQNPLPRVLGVLQSEGVFSEQRNRNEVRRGPDNARGRARDGGTEGEAGAQPSTAEGDEAGIPWRSDPITTEERAESERELAALLGEPESSNNQAAEPADNAGSFVTEVPKAETDQENLLESYTEQDISDREAAQADIPAQEQKAQIDREREEFTLDNGGNVSVSASNDALQKGQGGDMFAPTRKAPSTPETFVKAPNGTDDFGEISADVARAAGRQAGKIRLQKGNDQWGLQHIESRHGDEIRSAGFDSVESFVSDIAGNIDQVWKPEKTRQLVAIHSVGNNRLLFVELKPGKDQSGDFYTVKTAYISRKGGKKGWSLLWENRAKSSSESGNRPSFAEPSQKTGEKATNPESQSKPSIGQESNKSQSVLPKILTDSRKKTLIKMAKEQGIKRRSPGYAAAMERLGEEYDQAVDKAQAGLTFEQFNDLNPESPESLNRQAYDGLREEHGITDAETVDIDTAASEADTSPTEAQKEAGNYRLGHIKIQGLDISVENPKGSERSGTDPDGNKWSVTMNSHYGYLKGTKGADSEHVDVFVGPESESQRVYIVDQVNPDGSFDEHKVMVGYRGKLAATKAYKDNYTKGWKVGPVTSMTMDEFKAWLKDGDNTKPLNADHFAGAKKKVDKPKPAKQEAPAQPIEDFGEKIAGARKDYAATMSDAKQKDSASVPLSESWPAPDYQKMVDSGADKKVVALARALRESVSSKPRAGWKLSGWVRGMEARREVAEMLIDGSGSIDSLDKLSGSPMIRDIQGVADLYEAVGHGKSLKGLSLASASYSLYDGVVQNPAKVVWTVDQKAKSSAFSNMPRRLAAGDTKAEVLAKFKELYSKLDDTKKASAKKVRFDIYTTRRNPSDVYIGRKIGRDVVRIKDGFKDVYDARDYIRDNQDDLESLLAKMKDVPAHRKETNSPRVGSDHRNGGDVSPEQFSEAFGFRGVQFGNWVDQGRRQADLNEAYDALMDMAGILNIPAKALSLNGELGLAFGARGRGGKRAAAAHYEPGTVAINLTKKNGAGSLAHEWFHALDNYFSRARKETGYLSETPFPAGEGVRPEVVGAFNELAQSVRRTGLYQRSRKLDRTRTKEYWSTGREMSARAFESYIIEKLKDQDASNDYLANIVSEEYWDAAAKMNEAFGGDGVETADSYPYPQAAEVSEIRAVFDNLFDVIEHKETAEGVALFSAASDLLAGNAVSRKKAQSAVDRIKRGAAASDIDIELHDTFDTMPEAVKRSAKSQGYDGARVKGVFINNKIHLNRSALGSEKEVEQTLFHELYGHYGIKKLFDAGTRQAMGRLYLRVGGIKGVRELANKHGISLEHYITGAGKAVKDGSMSRENAQSILADELLAHIAQDSKPGIVRATKELVGAVRSWLRGNGFLSLSKMGDTDLMYLLKQARQAVNEGRVTGQKGTLFDLAGIDGAGQPVAAFSMAHSNARKVIGDDPVLAGWTMLAQNDEAFQLPTSDKKPIEAIFKELEGRDGIQIVEAEEIALQDKHEPDRSWRIITPQGRRAAILQKGETVYIDVSSLDQGQDGKRIYNAVANYAHNNDLVFVGDPNGLSDVAQTRRLENMISSALKFGTTKHLWPHDNQVGGNTNVDMPNLDWKDGDDAHNLRQMIDVSYDATVKQFPKIKDLVYNPETDQIEDSTTGEVWDGKRFDAEARSLRGLQDGRGSRGPLTAGRTTLERAVLTNTLSRGTREEVARILERFGQLGSERLAAPKTAILYSTDSEPRQQGGVSRSGVDQAETPAFKKGFAEERQFSQTEKDYGGRTAYGQSKSEGKTKLNYRQWVQVRTPAFKDWFGDWENEPENSSKVVDSETGEPMVVYHRSEEDFSVFKRGERAGLSGKGIYFAVPGGGIPSHGRNQIDAFLNIRNPITRDIASNEKYEGINGNGSRRVSPDVFDAFPEFDGVMLRRDEVTVKDPTQIKSATGNNGDFNPENPDIRFSVSDDAPTFGRPQEKKVYGIPTDMLLRKLSDKMRPLLQTQRAIEKATGKTLSEELDAYRVEEAFHGKTENDLRKLKERFIEPLVDKMAKYDIAQEELDMFLWARHAPERNAQVAKINPDMPDGGSGMTNKQAANVLAKAKNEGKLARMVELADIVYAMQKRKQQLLAASLVEEGDINAWNENYKYYVPLKGRAEDESTVSYPRVGKGFDIRGKESLRALGRRTKPESPVLHSILDTTQAVIRSRKNEVGNAFLDLVEANPNPDYWQVFTAESPEFEPRLHKNKNGETVKLAPVIDRSRYFSVKRKGKEHFIKIDDENLMRAMKNMGPEPANWLTQYAGAASRFLSSVNTSYNPEFMITNFSRDFQTAVINVLAEQDLHDGVVKDQKIALKMAKSVPVAMRAVHASLRGKKLDGEAAKWQKAFNDFREDGAKTGWFDMKDINRQEKDLARMLEMAKNTTKGNMLRAKKAIGDFVDDANMAVENGVRLAAYKHAIDAGVSRKKAAQLAKNLTVNFNRKGEMGQTLNSLYMFFNASVQGVAVFARAVGTMKVVDGKKKLNAAQKLAITASVAAYGLAALNRATAGDDDDGVNWYDKVPAWAKERNIVIMKSILGGEPGEYWKIPLPYGYNIFHVLGTEAEGVAAGGGVGKSAMNIAQAVVGSFVPIGLAESDSFASSTIRTLTPTVGKPFADIVANENFFGGMIHRENAPYGTPKPESHLSKRSTPALWSWVSEFMNDSTGGSPYRSGAIDINPDKLNYVYEFFTGGAGRFGGRVQNVAEKLIQGREIEANEVPFLRQVSAKVSPYQSQTDFYNRKTEAEQLDKEWRSLRGKERVDFYKKHGKKIRLNALSKSVSKELANHRKHRDRIEENKNLSPREVDERLKRLEARMKKTVDRFNRVWPDD